MKKLLAAGLVAGSALFAGAPPVQAGASTDAALGLAAFAVFNQFVRGETVFHDIFLGRPAPVVVPQPVVVVPPPPPVVYAPPPTVVYAPFTPVVYVQPRPVVYHAPKWVPLGHHKGKYYEKVKFEKAKHHHGYSKHRRHRGDDD